MECKLRLGWALFSRDRRKDSFDKMIFDFHCFLIIFVLAAPINSLGNDKKNKPLLSWLSSSVDWVSLRRKLIGSNCILIERGGIPPYYDCIGKEILI